MPLPKHPRLMNDDELCAWVKALIERKAPESNSLDYKETISIRGKTKRIEIGKDVSSFANESGGILLYGVPEEEVDGVPVPTNLSKCGIEISDNLPTNVENILLDIVRPPLPELFIKVVNIPELKSGSLLTIHHPESWNKPHMVEGYEHARFYRRGNFRAIIMSEREIEAAYLSRKVSLDYADNFFETGDFRTIPTNGQFLRVIFCPRFTLIRREEMYEDKFKDWLDANPPEGRPGDWVPFLYGWSYLGYPVGNYHGKQYEYRLFHNGGFSYTVDLALFIDPERRLDLRSVERYVIESILPYVEKFFELLRISGPLSVQTNLYNVRRLSAIFSPAPLLFHRGLGVTSLEKESISFVEETSTSELRFNRDNVVKRLIDRLASAFGLRR